MVKENWSHPEMASNSISLDYINVIEIRGKQQQQKSGEIYEVPKLVYGFQQTIIVKSPATATIGSFPLDSDFIICATTIQIWYKYFPFVFGVALFLCFLEVLVSNSILKI